MSTTDESADLSHKNDIKKQLFCLDRGPGPAGYKLRTLTGSSDHCRTKPQAPSYSIGFNHKIALADTPGPQTYRYHSALTPRGIQETPAVSLKGRPKTREIEGNPGPGTYDYKLSPQTPRLSIGLPFKPTINNLPPPNAYDIKDGIGSSTRYRTSVPSYPVRSRTFFGSCYYDSFKADVPGPATYGPVDNRVHLPANGVFTIKSRTCYNPLWKPKEGPGPGTYNQSAGCNSSRGFSMGIRHSPYLMPVSNGHNMR